VNNKFKDFFNDPSKVTANFTPPRGRMIDAMLAVVGTDPLWYRNQQARLIVCALIAKIADTMREDQARNGKLVEDVWKCAFITTCSELLLNTHDRYASDEERVSFPINEDGTEFEQGEEFNPET
jgi:hypothetical protein